MIATNFMGSRDFDLMRHQSWRMLERFNRWLSGTICADVSADITNMNRARLYSNEHEIVIREAHTSKTWILPKDH